MTPRKAVLAAALAVGCALAVTGCGAEPGSEDDPTVAAESSAPAPPTSGPGSAASAAPAVPAKLAFTSETLTGEPFEGKALAGKPAVLWFWAPWCSRCRAHGPEVAKAAKKFDGKVNVIGVAGLSDDVGSMKDFVGNTDTDGLTHLSDGKGTVWKRFGITEQDTYVLIAADGSVKHSGPLDTDDLEDRFDKLAS
jgi:thiol-disulfide isomerase/thioredoxin